MIVQPLCQSVMTTQSATFTAVVRGVGAENFTYQWKHNGEIIKGEIGDILNLNNVAVRNEGSYTCIVKNQYEDSDAFTAELEVTSKHKSCAHIPCL